MEMKNARGHGGARHCVASNVKPYRRLKLASITPAGLSRVTHGTSLENERDKHVSVTGPPVEDRRGGPSEFDALFYLFPSSCPANRVISGLLSREFFLSFPRPVCGILFYTCPREVFVLTVVTFESFRLSGSFGNFFAVKEETIWASTKI